MANTLDIKLNLTDVLDSSKSFTPELLKVSEKAAESLTNDGYNLNRLSVIDEIITGATGYNMTPAEKVPYLKNLFEYLLRRAIEDIRNKGWAGVDIAAYNNLHNSLVQSFVNPILGLSPFAPGDASHFDLVAEAGVNKLAIAVNRV